MLNLSYCYDPQPLVGLQLSVFITGMKMLSKTEQRTWIDWIITTGQHLEKNFSDIFLLFYKMPCLQNTVVLSTKTSMSQQCCTAPVWHSPLPINVKPVGSIREARSPGLRLEAVAWGWKWFSSGLPGCACQTGTLPSCFWQHPSWWGWWCGLPAS